MHLDDLTGDTASPAQLHFLLMVLNAETAPGKA